MKKLILLLSLFISLASASQEDYSKYKSKPSNSPSEVKQPEQRVLDENYHYTEQYPYPHYHRGRRHRECDGHYDGWARQEWRYFVGGLVSVAAAVSGYLLYETLVGAAH